MNVYTYFTRNFPTTRVSLANTEVMQSMSLNSTCGDDCKRAIDAAELLARQVKEAHGARRPDMIDQAATVAVNVCIIFICGQSHTHLEDEQ